MEVSKLNIPEANHRKRRKASKHPVPLAGAQLAACWAPRAPERCQGLVLPQHWAVPVRSGPSGWPPYPLVPPRWVSSAGLMTARALTFSLSVIKMLNRTTAGVSHVFLASWAATEELTNLCLWSPASPLGSYLPGGVSSRGWHPRLWKAVSKPLLKLGWYHGLLSLCPQIQLFSSDKAIRLVRGELSLVNQCCVVQSTFLVTQRCVPRGLAPWCSQRLK